MDANEYCLDRCQLLYDAFSATQTAKQHLLACLQLEQNLLDQMRKPLHTCLQMSEELVLTTAAQKHAGQEQRHAEALLAGWLLLLPSTYGATHTHLSRVAAEDLPFGISWHCACFQFEQLSSLVCHSSSRSGRF